MRHATGELADRFHLLRLPHRFFGDDQLAGPLLDPVLQGRVQVAQRLVDRQTLRLVACDLEVADQEAGVVSQRPHGSIEKDPAAIFAQVPPDIRRGSRGSRLLQFRRGSADRPVLRREQIVHGSPDDLFDRVAEDRCSPGRPAGHAICAGPITGAVSTTSRSLCSRSRSSSCASLVSVTSVPCVKMPLTAPSRSTMG